MPPDESTARGGGDADRLDLDDLGPLLDLDSAVDLDVVGDDGPTTSQRLGSWLEGRGISPFVRRHRAATAALTALVVALAGLGLWWGLSRPAPLPAQPRVVASVTEVGPDLAETGPDGQATQVQQSVGLAVSEDPGTIVAVLGISGPGLGQVDGLPIVVADSANPDQPVLARGSLACGTTAQTAALSKAHDVDYRVVLRRAGRDGTSSTGSVALVGAQRLLDLVRSTCLQRAADRELRVSGLTISPVPSASVKLRLAFQVEASGPGSWPAVRVAPVARSTLVGLGAPLEVRPGSPTEILGELTPADCLTRTSGLEPGVQLSATPPGEPADEVDPPVLVALPTDAARTLAAAVRSLCGSARLSATVESAIMRSGSAPGTGGTLELDVSIGAPGADSLELAESVSAAGRLAPREQVLDVVGSTGRTQVTWLMPPCSALVDVGLPLLAVNAADRNGILRPYQLPLTGEALGIALTRLCPDVAPEIRLPG